MCCIPAHITPREVPGSIEMWIKNPQEDLSWINGILEDIVDYDANITTKDILNEVESIEEVKTSAEQREVTSKDSLKEISRRVMTGVPNQGNVRLVCNQCEAIYIRIKVFCILI